MAAESLVQMLEEIAVGLKAGDEEIYGWLRQQLKECGASEISVELAMGVISRLLPEEAQGNLEAAQQLRAALGALEFYDRLRSLGRRERSLEPLPLRFAAGKSEAQP